MKKFKFAVFTDLHYEHIHDAYQKLENFITNVRKTMIKQKIYILFYQITNLDGWKFN